jgi:hypothetical protein
MVMRVSASEVFGAQQGREHVERHADGGGYVDDGEDHRSDAPQQDGEAGEQGEHRRSERDIDEVHEVGSNSGAAHVSRIAIKGLRLTAGLAVNKR